MKKQFVKINRVPGLAIFCFSLFLMSFQNPAVEVCGTEVVSCPTASFTIQNNGCVGPCEITFINQSINATSYHWDFGDGNTSTEVNPKHTYQNAGTYTVTLTAILGGCQVDWIGTVDIINA